MEYSSTNDRETEAYLAEAAFTKKRYEEVLLAKDIPSFKSRAVLAQQLVSPTITVSLA